MLKHCYGVDNKTSNVLSRNLHLTMNVKVISFERIIHKYHT